MHIFIKSQFITKYWNYQMLYLCKYNNVISEFVIILGYLYISGERKGYRSQTETSHSRME